MGTIQKQHDEMAEVRERLEAWGAWLRATSICSLNYPRKTTFAIVSGGCDIDYEDPDAEEIENIMVKLKAKYPRLFDVLQQEYYFESDNISAAKYLGISVATYKSRRLVGEHFVAGVLEEF